MRYLFIGAHTDDCEVSCGGTMTKLYEAGNDVNCLALSYCDQRDLLKEYAAASEILGVNFYNEAFDVRCFSMQSPMIADALLKFNNFDAVFTHSINCRHPDHRTTAQESIRIFNKTIVSYIQPWNGFHEDNYYVELSETQLEKKIEAISCYKSQAHRQYMQPDFIRSWARYNGIKANCKYAEGFRILRRLE